MNDEIFLTDGDVVSMSIDQSFTKTTTAKVSEIKQALLKSWLPDSHSRWIGNGASCEVLLTEGGGWRKGRIRFRVEFIPDIPPAPTGIQYILPSSPLDDLRSQLKE